VAWGFDTGIIYVTTWGSSSCPAVAVGEVTWDGSVMRIGLQVGQGRFDEICTEDWPPHTTITRIPDSINEAVSVDFEVFWPTSQWCGRSLVGTLTPGDRVSRDSSAFGAAEAVFDGEICGTPAAPGTASPGDARTASATWRIDPASVGDLHATEFTALVSRLGCSGGVTGHVYAPELTWDMDSPATELVVTFRVEHLGDGAFTCPGNDEVPVVVRLADVPAPTSGHFGETTLGGVILRDGVCAAGEDGFGTVFCNNGDVRWNGSQIIDIGW
jgi:hypothetical protein